MHLSIFARANASSLPCETPILTKCSTSSPVPGTKKPILSRAHLAKHFRSSVGWMVLLSWIGRISFSFSSEMLWVAEHSFVISLNFLWSSCRMWIKQILVIYNCTFSSKIYILTFPHTTTTKTNNKVNRVFMVRPWNNKLTGLSLKTVNKNLIRFRQSPVAI